MDELAREAGVGKGTLYRRFEDRASLCRALIQDEALKLQKDVLEGFGLPPTTAWIDRLGKLMDELFDFVMQHASLLSEALAFERGRPGRYDHPTHAWQRETIVHFLTRAMDSEEIPALDAVTTAELILAGLDPDLLQWNLSRGLSKNDLRTRFSDFWRKGVGHPNC